VTSHFGYEGSWAAETTYQAAAAAAVATHNTANSSLQQTSGLSHLYAADVYVTYYSSF